MNPASVVVTCEVVGAFNHYRMVKKNEHSALTGYEDVNYFSIISSSSVSVLSLVLPLSLVLARYKPLGETFTT